MVEIRIRGFDGGRNNSSSDFRAHIRRGFAPWTHTHLLPPSGPSCNHGRREFEPAHQLDELNDFDGEAPELAGDFFFEVESDEGKLLRIICYLFDVWVDSVLRFVLFFEQRRKAMNTNDTWWT
jgi:hypothetical protein